MPLLAYNLTTSPIALAAGAPIVTLPVASSAGARGAAVNVTAELKGQLAAAFALLQTQAAPQTGVGDSFAVSGSDVTLTDAAGAFVAANVGQLITILGAASPNNNGLFLVTAVLSATQIVFTNAAGVAEAYAGPYSLPNKVEYEWSALPEFSTFTLNVGSAQRDIAENDVSLFAATTGADTNPGTFVQPVLTARQLNLLSPGKWKKGNLAFLGAGTYGWAEFGIHGMNGFFDVNSSPLAMIGAYTTVFGPVAVTAVNADGSVDVPGITALTSGTGDSFAFAGSTVTLTDAAGGFVAAGVKAGMSVTIAGSTTPANDGTFLITAVGATTLAFTNTAGVAEAFPGTWSVLIDRFYGVPRFTIVSGPGAGSTRMCAGNTATALLPSSPLASVAIGSVVQLEEPATIINFTTSLILAWSHLGFKGIKFQRTSGNFILAEEGQADFEGCTMDLSTGGNITLTSNGRIRGASAGPWASLVANNPFSAFRNNGLFVDASQGVNNSINIFNGGSFLGNHLLRNVDVGMNNQAYCSLGAHGRNTSFTCGDNSTLRVSGTSVTARVKFSGHRPGTPWLFGAFDNGMIERLNFMDAINCIGNPIQVGSDVATPSGNFYGRNGSRANVGDVGGAANNTGVGIKYTKGSRVLIDAVAGSAVTSVTGVGGDTQGEVVAVDTQTYAAVRAVDANGVAGWPDTLASTINLGNRISPPAP